MLTPLLWFSRQVPVGTLVLLFLALAVVVACSRSPSPEPAQAPYRGGGPLYEGPSSLEERIAGADVIARVQLRSVSSAAEQLAGHSGYVGAMELRFQVLEYLKGGGASELVAVAYDPGESFGSTRDATERGDALKERRDTTWDNREAIIFLRSGHSELPSSQQANRYWLGTVSAHTSEDFITIASPHTKRWLPDASAGGARGASVGTQHFLLDVPSTVGAGGASGQSSTPTITLSEMKSRVAAIEREVAAGGGSQAYRDCLYLKYQWERQVRYRKDFMERRGQSYYYMRFDESVGSGLPAETLVHTSLKAADTLRLAGPTPPPDAGEFVLRGPDEDLFDPRWPGVAVAARPLPAGTYRFYFASRWQSHIICDALPEEELKRFEVFVTVTAPAGTVHEAFFDPATVSGGIGAVNGAVGGGGVTGVLRPADFTAGGVSTALQSLKWQGGTATLELSAPASLSGHALDFIALDGSVALSLAGGATVAATHTWSVANQPWQAGDRLMLRIRQAVVPPTATPTATATPEPTATATSPPAPPTADPCLENIGTLTSTRWSARVWLDGECRGGTLSNARFYTFTLAERSTVFISLEPARSTNQRSFSLYLRQGAAKEGPTISSATRPTGRTSMLLALVPGVYTLEGGVGAGRPTAVFRITIVA